MSVIIYLIVAVLLLTVFIVLPQVVMSHYVEQREWIDLIFAALAFTLILLHMFFDWNALLYIMVIVLIAYFILKKKLH